MAEEAPAAAPAKVPKKKAAAPRLKKEGPSLPKLIIAAVTESKERKGMSLAAIKKVLGNKGVDLTKSNKRINIAVTKLVATGTLTRTKGTGASGSFKLGKEPKPVKKVVKKSPVKAKKSAAKKPAAKKPAAKKPAAKKPAAKKPAAKKPAAKKPAAKKPAAKKSPKKKAVKKPAAKTTPKKAAPKKVKAAKKPAAKKTPVKKAAAKKSKK